MMPRFNFPTRDRAAADKLTWTAYEVRRLDDGRWELLRVDRNASAKRATRQTIIREWTVVGTYDTEQAAEAEARRLMPTPAKRITCNDQW